MLVGVCGKKGSGKDTVSDYIVKKYNFSKYAFADSLKKACMEIFGLSYEQLYTDLKDVMDPFWKKTPRQLMQQLGTDMIRNNFGDYVWIHSLAKKLDHSKNNIISDVRFNNEYDFVKEKGGFIIKVVRPNLVSDDDHISENELDDCKADIVIVNDGDLDSLYKKIDLYFPSKEIY